MDASENITSDTNGDITTTGDKANEGSGNVTMNAGLNVLRSFSHTVGGYIPLFRLQFIYDIVVDGRSFFELPPTSFP